LLTGRLSFGYFSVAVDRKVSRSHAQTVIKNTKVSGCETLLKIRDKLSNASPMDITPAAKTYQKQGGWVSEDRGQRTED